jgi:hypothetical protein
MYQEELKKLGFKFTTPWAEKTNNQRLKRQSLRANL